MTRFADVKGILACVFPLALVYLNLKKRKDCNEADKNISVSINNLLLEF